MQQQASDKQYLKLLKKNRRQCERKTTEREQIDIERASLKRKVQYDDAYDQGGGELGSGVVVAKPMSLVLYEMKQQNDPRIVYSDLMSRGRYQLTMKRQRQLYGAPATADIEAYLQKQPLCELLDWQQDAMSTINDREADKANLGSRGVMLCLDMGLGKTIITLAYLLYDNQRCFRQTGSRYNGCTLIAVPNKLLIEGWLYEARTKWPANSFVYHVLHSGKNRQISHLYIQNCCDFMLVTYATIRAAYRYKCRQQRKQQHQEEDDEEDDDDGEEEEEEEDDDESIGHEDVPMKVNRAREAQEYKYNLLYKTAWKRIVADENHHFVNERARLFRAMTELESGIKWGLTGTPIQNRLSDICASFSFIGIPQFLNYELEISDEKKEEIKEILKLVMIRKLKSELSSRDNRLMMMPVVKTIKLIEFESLQEKVIYYLYATYGSRHWRENIGGGANKQQSLSKNHTNIASILQLMMQLCIGMRIVKDLVLPRGLLTLGNEEELHLRETQYKECLFDDEITYADGDNTLEYFASLLAKKTTFGYKSSSNNNALLTVPDGYKLEYRRSLQSASSSELPGLSDQFVWDPFKKSEHFDMVEDRAEYQAIYDTLCTEGVESARDLLKQGTPKTKAIVKHLVARTLRAPHYSSKNRHIIKHIQEEVPLDDKVIVFSNSIRGLECLERDLSRHGIDVIMVNGTTKDNTERITRFKEGNVRVLLLSFKLGNVGLNITCANHIIFMHPWWNPHMIEQAADRVHRLGQLKTVFIVHFILNQTIDLYVLNLSHDKKSMTSSIIGKQQDDKQPENYAHNLYEYSISQ